jgi:tetratricopeptide (TPR) repeat protein
MKINFRSGILCISSRLVSFNNVLAFLFCQDNKKKEAAMRRILIGLTAVLILACQPGPSQKDDAAIVKAVQDELDGYVQRDHEKWASMYVHEPYTTFIYVHSSGYQRIVSWDSLDALMKSHFADTSAYVYQHQKLVSDIQNFGKTAMVSAEEITRDPRSSLPPDSNDIVLFMEKRNGNWLFVNQMVFFKSTYSGTDQNIEGRLNMIGYQLMWNKKIKEAISLFSLNVGMFPESANAYDSLGEAYMKAGKCRLAVQNYEKSLKLNPKNANAAAMLKKLKEGK